MPSPSDDDQPTPNAWLIYLGRRRPTGPDDAPNYREDNADRQRMVVPIAHTLPANLTGLHIGDHRETVEMSDYDSHAGRANALIEVSKENIGVMLTHLRVIKDILQAQIPPFRGMEEMGQQTVGAIMAAGEGSAVHDYRIGEAAQTVHYATHDQATGTVSAIQQAVESLNTQYTMLSNAYGQLEEVRF